MTFRLRSAADPISSVFPALPSSTDAAQTPLIADLSESLTTMEDYDRFLNPHFPPESESDIDATPSNSIADLLPYEVLSRIFWNLDASETIATASMGHLPAVLTASTQQFELTCRLFKRIADDPHARCAWIIKRYGTRLGLFYAYKFHKNILTPEVGQLLITAGCNLPRFLVQLVDKEYHQRVDRARRQVSVPTLMFFLEAGYEAYGLNVDFREDDVARFERSLYGVTNTAQESSDIVKGLIDNYLFVPVRGLGSPIDETVYLVSKLDVNFIPALVKNGLQLSFVNDLIMERLLWRSDITDAIVVSYLRVGFELTAPAVKKGLQMGRASTLDILKKHIASLLLETHAQETVYDMFGPSIRGWNFTAEAIDFLRTNFIISEDTMERAILRFPNGISPDAPDAFPATRSYMKANPCPVWRWILRTYGPAHRLTMACFDDAISRAAAERELHALHDVFLESGVLFRPRHVKILACRVLHRDMTANALHLLKIMREQIMSSAREYLKQQQVHFSGVSIASVGADTINNKGKEGSGSSSFNFIFGTGISNGFNMFGSGSNSLPPAIELTSTSALTTLLTAGTSTLEPLVASPTSSSSNKTEALLTKDTFVPALSPDQRNLWLKAFSDEITGNEEWENRMRTTQLEGGPRGGAYRISRAPEDAVRFLDEAKEIVAELNALEKMYSSVRATTGVVPTGKVPSLNLPKSDGKRGKIVTRSLSSGAASLRRATATPARSIMRNQSLNVSSSEVPVGARSESAPSTSSTTLSAASSTSTTEEVERPPSAAISRSSGFLIAALNHSSGMVLEQSMQMGEQGIQDQDLEDEARQGNRYLDGANVSTQTEEAEAGSDEAVFDLDGLHHEPEEDDDTHTITPSNAHNIGTSASFASFVAQHGHSLSTESLPNREGDAPDGSSLQFYVPPRSSTPLAMRRRLSQVFRSKGAFWKNRR
ncbi:hypothetical protein BC830DRAFT_1098788 [Chytriomyces sp. MP71]|nr:hypothetical protein BC830DRAFT_1098788 [Chytriomyces sp. MP71]